MTFSIIGTAFGDGVYQAKDVVSDHSNGERTIVRSYRVMYEGWEATAPSINSPHPIFTTATLVSRECKQIEPGILCEVTLTYKRPAVEPEPGTTPLPPDEYIESANEVEMPIEAHPNFETFATEANGAIFTWEQSPLTGLWHKHFKAWDVGSPFVGYLTYKVASVTESVTTYHWSKPSSVSGEVGECSDGWLTISGSIGRRYPYWTRTINRIWSARDWPSIIYPV